ncbi:MAG: hypothetical protein ACT4TC_23855 [Myxococcaceae bacterium]
MSDRTKLPVPHHSERRYKDDTRDQRHQTKEWSSGTRGGGKLPPDFGWKTNPKQWQEEHGAAIPEKSAPPAATPTLPAGEKAAEKLGERASEKK